MHWLWRLPVLLSSRKVLVLEDPRGPIFKCLSLSSNYKSSSLSLSLKLDSLSLSSSLSLESLTTTLATTVATTLWTLFSLFWPRPDTVCMCAVWRFVACGGGRSRTSCSPSQQALHCYTAWDTTGHQSRGDQSMLYWLGMLDLFFVKFELQL